MTFYTASFGRVKLPLHTHFAAWLLPLILICSPALPAGHTWYNTVTLQTSAVSTSDSSIVSSQRQKNKQAQGYLYADSEKPEIFILYMHTLWTTW